MTWFRWTILALLVAWAGGCKGCSDANPVVVYTSVDQVFSEPVLLSCAKAEGLDLRPVFDTEETKSTGILNRLLAEAGHPQADLFWSGDPVRTFVLVDRGMVQPYRSPSAEDIPGEFKAEDGMWTGFAARARVLLVNHDLVPRGEEPRSIRDLAAPRWAGKAAMANPLYGTTTMHVAALFTVWGEAEAKRFLDAVKANRVRIASSNGEVKRLVEAGEVAFGLTDTDDAYEAVRSHPNLSVVYPDQQGMGTLFMPTTVVLIEGAPHPAAARAMIDCLLGPDTERRMAEAAAHMPLRSGIPTPKGVMAAGGLRTMEVDYAAVAKTMGEIEPWLRRWVGM